MLNIPRIYITDYDSRPVTGFDSPAGNDNSLYFRFENLPDDPSGHLARDIIDALSKGTVTGSAGIDPEDGSARFSLFISITAEGGSEMRRKNTAKKRNSMLEPVSSIEFTSSASIQSGSPDIASTEPSSHVKASSVFPVHICCNDA